METTIMPPRVGHILRLAEIIREVDGKHDKGACRLAEAILSHPDSRWQPRKDETNDQMKQALVKAECALADIAEGEVEVDQTSADAIEWAEHRAASTLEQIRPVMLQYGVPTSEWPPHG